jgi:hypothetical protein
MNGFEKTIDLIRSTMALLPDNRTGGNTQYSMQDAGLAAFSVFFMQSPSFLSAQQAMEKRKGRSNAQTLFNIGKIPTPNQIRNLLDPVEPKELFPVYDSILAAFRARGVLDDFRSVGGTQLIALDGTWYHSSGTIHCANCSTKQHKDGSITYSHSVITPVIVAPGRNQAIALRPEFILPQDGDEKQDCEIKAAKRWLAGNGGFYRTGNDTLLGDDLYAHQPFCRQILLHGYHFIFVCKPTSHKYLHEWIGQLEPGIDLHTQTERIKNNGKWETHVLRFANNVPLADEENALRVNWIEHVVRIKGKQTYQNSFATDHAINPDNALEIASAGRARWKIENENNNTLKTKGYHLDHNFGHGKQHLSSLLASMNILAFLLHTLLEVDDKAYLLIREALGARKTFFEHVRALTHYRCFVNWDEMMDFMLRGLELGPYDSG